MRCAVPVPDLERAALILMRASDAWINPQRRFVVHRARRAHALVAAVVRQSTCPIGLRGDADRFRIDRHAADGAHAGQRNRRIRSAR